METINSKRRTINDGMAEDSSEHDGMEDEGEDDKQYIGIKKN